MSGTSSLWAPCIERDLSQGDIVDAVPVGVAVDPIQFLKKASLKGGKPGWMVSSKPQSKEGNLEYWPTRGRLVPVVVLSHSCDLDKPDRRARVVVAPVTGASGLTSSAWMTILSSGRRAMLPLPGLPGLGDAYADLRLTCTVDRSYIDTCARLASMSAPGVTRLQVHFVGFVARG